MDTEKIKEKIAYKTERIKKLQEEIKSLKRKKTQLENEKILNICRQAQVNYAELSGILTELKRGRLIHEQTDQAGTNAEYQGDDTPSKG